MSHYLIQQIAQISNIHVHTRTEVIAADGDGHLQQIVLRNNETGAEEKVRVATHVVDNDGARAATEAQVDALLAKLRR